jgi:predicted nucleic acid-binding protein
MNDESKVFFDTNILLYLLSSNTSKADRAETLIATGGIISVQVLNEFASVASRKLKMSWMEIREVLETIRCVCHIEPIMLNTHDYGFALSERYGFSIYDGMILASALLADCGILFTEDLQNGQSIDDKLIVKNPFLAQYP